MLFYEKVMTLICALLVIASWHVRSEPLQASVELASPSVVAETSILENGARSPSPAPSASPAP